MKRRTPYRFSRPAPSTARPPHQRVRTTVLERELYYHNDKMRTFAFIFFTLYAFLTGCNTYNPVTVAVTNSIGEPVAGASVQAAPMYFFNPSDTNYIIVGPYDILEPFPADGDRGTTDENGLVELEIVTKSPLELNVFADGFKPWKGQIAISKQGDAEITQRPNESTLRITVGSCQ